VGWGGCFAYRSPRRVYEAVEEFVPDLLDRDFVDITDLTRALERRAEEKREVRWAAAGIELAAWDLLGKQRGVSVYELLREDGRPPRTRIPIYASLPRYERVDDSVCAAEMCMQQGFAAIKLHKVDVASVAAMRKRVGTEVQMMMDVNCAWSIDEAVDMCRQLQPFGLRWLEEPIGPATDYAALSQVRQQAHVPIACGENALNETSLCSAIEAAAADIYQPSLLKVGGLMAMRRMVNQA
jgi:D-galactarolactone cycloisomerase